MRHTNIIAEIGINHNGDVEVAKQLIDVATISGCDYVKFQKRNPELCVPDHMKNTTKDTPWGEMPYLDYKHKIEFGSEEYDELFDYSDSKGIGMFASVWDEPSVDFMKDYTGVMKIPSALITNDSLISYARTKADYLMVSTGMCSEDEIDRAVKISNPDLMFHTNSSYPSAIQDLNLNYINWLKDKHPNREIGYSGHEYGLITTFAAMAMGATWIERHITLDRTMWGSDQVASVEPMGVLKLVKGIRDIEKSLGKAEPRTIHETEMPKRKALMKNAK